MGHVVKKEKEFWGELSALPQLFCLWYNRGPSWDIGRELGRHSLPLIFLS